MDIEQLRPYLDECYKLLNADNVVSQREAELRAGKFLEAQYRIAALIQVLSSNKLKIDSLASAKYSQILNADTAKNVTEKKLNVEANPDYIEVREKNEEIETNLNYLRAVAKIFSDAHVFFRQLAKGEDYGKI